MVLLTEGMRKEEWAHTSSILAMLHNMFAKRTKKPEEFNPTLVEVPGIGGSDIANIKNIWMTNNGSIG